MAFSTPLGSHLGVDLDGISRQDLLQKPHIIDPQEQGDLPRIPLRGQQQDIRRLGHAFHRVHAGQHRLTGEVALENLAGRVHKKCGHDVVACLHLLHGIHQQHGVPVGDDGLDLFFGKLHDSGSSLSRKTLRI